MLTSNPYERGAGRAARRHGGLSAARRAACACATTTGASRARPARSATSRSTGPNVFKGYWRMPEKTREEFTADG